MEEVSERTEEIKVKDMGRRPEMQKSTLQGAAESRERGKKKAYLKREEKKNSLLESSSGRLSEASERPSMKSIPLFRRKPIEKK